VAACGGLRGLDELTNSKKGNFKTLAKISAQTKVNPKFAPACVA
jgi:hypothetical protein